MFENWRESLVDIVNGAETYRESYVDALLDVKAFQVESSWVDVLSSPIDFPLSFEVDCTLKLEKFLPKGRAAMLVADGKNFESVMIDEVCAAALKSDGYIRKTKLVLVSTGDLPKEFKIVEKKDGVLFEKEFEVFGKDMVHEWKSDGGQRLYSKPHTGARVPLHPYGGMLDCEHPLGGQVFLGVGFSKNKTILNVQFAHKNSQKHAYLLTKSKNSDVDIKVTLESGDFFQNYTLHTVRAENTGLRVTFKKMGEVFVK